MLSNHTLRVKLSLPELDGTFDLTVTTTAEDGSKTVEKATMTAGLDGLMQPPGGLFPVCTARTAPPMSPALRPPGQT